MALTTLINRIKNLTSNSTTIALTFNNMLNLDPTVSAYSLASLYTSLTTVLAGSAISIVQDTTNNVLVFIPNSRATSGLIASLSTVSNAQSNVQASIGAAVPAVFTNSSPTNFGASVIASVNFNGNPNQLLYRALQNNLFFSHSYISFWIANPTRFFIGMYDNLKYSVNSDYIDLFNGPGFSTINTIRTWQSNGQNLQSGATATNIPYRPGFNHVVISLDPNYLDCYVNGTKYQMRNNYDISKPQTNSSSYLLIGQTIHLNNVYGSNCRIKNIATIGYTTNSTLIEELYSLGENGNPAVIGTGMSHHWYLNGDGSDTISGQVTLNSQLINYAF